MASINYGELAAGASKGNEPLPVNQYDVEVTNVTFKKNNSGNDMYNVEFTVTAGPHKGRKVWNNLSLTIGNPNAVGMFFGQMRSLGLDDAFFVSVSDLEDDAQHGAICQKLIGNQAGIKVKHREWNGQIQNDVERIIAATGSSTPDVSTITPGDVAAVPAAVTAAPALPPGM